MRTRSYFITYTVSLVAFLALSTSAFAKKTSHEPVAKQRTAEEIIAVKGCGSCHGVDGAGKFNGVSTSPAFPTIAGQYKTYLQQALIQYRNGALKVKTPGALIRNNGSMSPMVNDLSDKDIAVLAAYISKLPGPLVQPQMK